MRVCCVLCVVCCVLCVVRCALCVVRCVCVCVCWDQGGLINGGGRCVEERAKERASERQSEGALQILLPHQYECEMPAALEAFQMPQSMVSVTKLGMFQSFMMACTFLITPARLGAPYLEP